MKKRKKIQIYKGNMVILCIVSDIFISRRGSAEMDLQFLLFVDCFN